MTSESAVSPVACMVPCVRFNALVRLSRVGCNKPGYRHLITDSFLAPQFVPLCTNAGTDVAVEYPETRSATLPCSQNSFSSAVLTSSSAATLGTGGWLGLAG